MKIFAMGGGENGWNGTVYNMEVFDKEIVRLSGKRNPVLLFIGFSAIIEEEYFEVIKANFEKLGCLCNHLTKNDCRKGHAEIMINDADIIYVGGGNTNKLMRAIRRFKIDNMLSDVDCRDKVFCGVSAGAICWCSFGNSIKLDNMGQKTTFRIRGIGFINLLFCPHILRDPFRKKDVEKMVLRTKGVNGIALDNAALEIIDDKYRIFFIKGEKSAAFKLTARSGEVVWSELSNHEFLDINSLIN